LIDANNASDLFLFLTFDATVSSKGTSTRQHGKGQRSPMQTNEKRVTTDEGGGNLCCLSSFFFLCRHLLVGLFDVSVCLTQFVI
jgi:hypothetical protein